jgi:hypothetical protein
MFDRFQAGPGLARLDQTLIDTMGARLGLYVLTNDGRPGCPSLVLGALVHCRFQIQIQIQRAS